MSDFEKDYSIIHQSALFPASNEPTEEELIKIIPIAPLFPAASDDNKNENDLKKSLNWLTNKSYSTEAALGITSYLQENKEKEKYEIEKDVSETSSQTKVHKEVQKIDLYEKEARKSKHKKKSRDRSRSPIKSKEEIEKELIAQKSNKIFIEQVRLNPEHAFRIDRKCDKNMLAFKSMYHMHIARYLSKTYKWPMGIDGTSIIDWLNSTKDKKKNLASCRYYSKQNFLKWNSETDVLDFTKHYLVYDSNKFRKITSYSGDYIPMEISINDLANKPEIDSLAIGDSSLKGYFAETDPKKGSYYTSENYADILEIPKKESSSEYFKRKTTEFNQSLRENPTDEQKWLEFLAFQDEINRLPKQLASEIGSFTEKSLFEKKLAILDRALSVNPKSVRLMVSRLELGKNYWETSKLKKEWKQLTFSHPNDIYVWEHYLLFLQTRYSSFSFTNVMNGYIECFSKLISIHEGKFQSHSSPLHLEEKMIGLFSRLCYFLNQTGHNERALALYQALIEFTFFTPASLTHQMDLQDWLAFFEPFWDSGMPRFGEEDAIGWTEVMKMKQFPNENYEKKGLDEQEDIIIQQNLSKSETWLKIEKLRESHHWLPWRQNLNDQDDEHSEDPDRMILFDDISPFLFRLTTVQHKFLLIKNFLKFLGVCSNPHPLTYCQSCQCHCCFYIDIMDYPLIVDNEFHYKFSNIKENLPSLFHLEKNNRTEKYFLFVQNVFEKSLKFFPNLYCTELIVLWLQHKRTQISYLKTLHDPSFKQTLKETKKAAKNILKEETNRNNLSLWYEYCKLEEIFGSRLEVKKMLEMILKSNPGVALKSDLTEQDVTLCKLYRLYAEVELEMNSISTEVLTYKHEGKNYTNSKPISVLASLGAGEKFGIEITPSIILKARNRFLNTVSSFFTDYSSQVNISDSDTLQILLLHRNNFPVEWCQCYALFQYLTIGLHPASIVYENAITKLMEYEKQAPNNVKLRNKLRLDLELIYHAYLRLLLYHVNNNISSLKVIRTVLIRAITVFPTSPSFLHLLVNLESRSHIAGRLRRHFHHWIQVSQSPIISLYSLLAEMFRKENLMASCLAANNQSELPFATLPEDGIINQISSIFEHSIKLSGCQNCPLLWRLYIAFEIKKGNFAKAKAVFYQAVQNCPWVKCLYLDGVKAFSNDTEEILDIMAEKEIRLRAPLEEIDLLKGLITQAKETSNDKPSLEMDTESSPSTVDASNFHNNEL